MLSCWLETSSSSADTHPIKFLHSITSTWTIAKTSYYRHKVVLKNTSEKPITNMKLVLENLEGPLWGLSPTPQKNTYELPQWQKVLQPGAECTFVYVQGGPQAKISIQSYNWSIIQTRCQHIFPSQNVMCRCKIWKLVKKFVIQSILDPWFSVPKSIFWSLTCVSGVWISPQSPTDTSDGDKDLLVHSAKSSNSIL